jgi:hypothetical protein
MENNGWNYLRHFDKGVIEATGRKATLKHVIVSMQHDAAKGIVHCFIDGTAEPEMMQGLSPGSEFMVRIKCVDKEAGSYLTARGKASLREKSEGANGLRAAVDIKITGVAAYHKETDENGIDYLVNVYNDMNEREDKKAKLITDYEDHGL